MINAYKNMMTNYANFKGRLGIKDFWLAFLCYFLMTMVISLVFGFIVGLICGIAKLDLQTGTFIANGFVSLFSLAHLVPLLAAEVRRLHDTNKSGWFVLTSLIPCVGGIVLIVLLCMAPVNQGNKY